MFPFVIITIIITIIIIIIIIIIIVINMIIIIIIVILIDYPLSEFIVSCSGQFCEIRQERAVKGLIKSSKMILIFLLFKY